MKEVLEGVKSFKLVLMLLICATLALIILAVIANNYHSNLRRLSDRIIDNPFAALSEDEIAILVEGILEGEVAPEDRRSLFAKAIVKRSQEYGGAIILECIMQRWKNTGEYDVVVREIERSVTKRNPNCNVLLLSLAAYDDIAAQDIVAKQKSWINVDIELFSALLLAANEDTIMAHANEIRERISMPDFPSKLKAYAERRLDRDQSKGRELILREEKKK